MQKACKSPVESNSEKVPWDNLNDKDGNGSEDLGDDEEPAVDCCLTRLLSSQADFCAKTLMLEQASRESSETFRILLIVYSLIPVDPQCWAQVCLPAKVSS